MSTELKQDAVSDAGKTTASKAPKNSGSAELASPEFTMNDDQQVFAKFLEVVKGEVPAIDTPERARIFLVNYNQWVAEGRPRPKLEPRITEGVAPIPMKLYRVKSLGRQYLYFRDTLAKVHGRETDTVTNRLSYLEGFKKEAAEKLVDDAQKRCHNPTYYLVVGEDKYSVTPEDFVSGDFDQLVMQHKHGRYIG